MDKQDIIRMAQEVGFSDGEIDTCQLMLERFASLVASAERERFCAVLRQWHDTYSLISDPSTIRARGQA